MRPPLGGDVSATTFGVAPTFSQQKIICFNFKAPAVEAAAAAAQQHVWGSDGLGGSVWASVAS